MDAASIRSASGAFTTTQKANQWTQQSGSSSSTVSCMEPGSDSAISQTGTSYDDISQGVTCVKTYVSSPIRLGGGGLLSNTPPQNLQTDFDPARDRLTGGEDWFEVMVYLRWTAESLEAVTQALDAAKEDAAGDGDGWTQSVPGCEGGLFKVEPHGCRLGEGGKGPVMRWLFSRDGITFGLTKRAEPHKTLPSGFVRMTGELLIAFGDAKALWTQVVEWFRAMGAEVTLAKVSRVDMCVDLPGVEVREFVEMYLSDRFITRTKRSRQYSETPDNEESADDDPSCLTELYRSGRSYTGLRLGVGTQLRIYDKLAECQDLVKRAWLAHRRWGGSVPDAATRVEFQLRRSFLTAEKVKPDADGKIGRPVIDTVDDYFERRAELAGYLTRRWVCFFDQDFDRRHPERASVDARWTEVQAAFAAWAGKSEPGKFTPIQRDEVRVDDLMKQALGCIESAAARCGLDVQTDEDLFWFVAEQLHPMINKQTDHAGRVMKRMRAIIRPVPADPALLPV